MEIYEKYLTEGPFRFGLKDIEKALNLLDFVANEIKGSGNEFIIKVYGTQGKESAGDFKIDGRKMSKSEAVKYLNKYI